MYLIINKTLCKTIKHEGSYPLKFIDSLLDNDNDIIVISLYSNTIKIPNGFEKLNGIKEYKWKEFGIPVELLKNYLN